VVVADRFTEMLEPVTEPIPWSMVSADAPTTLHVSVADLPDTTLDGVAPKATMTGVATVTVVLAVELPNSLVAVSVNVVVEAGVTDTLDPVTIPTPWLMTSEVAPVTLQERIAGDPTVTVAGEAPKNPTCGAEPVLAAPSVPPPQETTPKARTQRRSGALERYFKPTMSVPLDHRATSAVAMNIAGVLVPLALTAPPKLEDPSIQDGPGCAPE
jgi:hypothetical protein